LIQSHNLWIGESFGGRRTFLGEPSGRKQARLELGANVWGVRLSLVLLTVVSAERGRVGTAQEWPTNSWRQGV